MFLEDTMAKQGLIGKRNYLKEKRSLARWKNLTSCATYKGLTQDIDEKALE